jgi:hypothetical protein
MTDYKTLYESRSAEFDELNEQFILYQCKPSNNLEETNGMIN